MLFLHRDPFDPDSSISYVSRAFAQNATHDSPSHSSCPPISFILELALDFQGCGFHSLGDDGFCDEKESVVDDKGFGAALGFDNECDACKKIRRTFYNLVIQQRRSRTRPLLMRAMLSSVSRSTRITVSLFVPLFFFPQRS